MSIKVFLLIFSAFVNQPDGRQDTGILPPRAFQTLADCEKVRSEFEAKLKAVKDDSIVAYRIQCVDNSMPLKGQQTAGI